MLRLGRHLVAAGDLADRRRRGRAARTPRSVGRAARLMRSVRLLQRCGDLRQRQRLVGDVDDGFEHRLEMRIFLGAGAGSSTAGIASTRRRRRVPQFSARIPMPTGAPPGSSLGFDRTCGGLLLSIRRICACCGHFRYAWVRFVSGGGFRDAGGRGSSAAAASGSTASAAGAPRGPAHLCLLRPFPVRRSASSRGNQLRVRSPSSPLPAKVAVGSLRRS